MQKCAHLTENYTSCTRSQILMPRRLLVTYFWTFLRYQNQKYVPRDMYCHVIYQDKKVGTEKKG